MPGLFDHLLEESAPAADAAPKASSSSSKRGLFDHLLDEAPVEASPVQSSSGGDRVAPYGITALITGQKQKPVDPKLKAAAERGEISDAAAAGVPGDDVAAVGRGLIDGVPVVGPYILGGVNRGVAAVRALQNGTTFPDELRKVEAFGENTAKEHPGATIGGELAGGVVGSAPLVAAAPAAFGAGAGSLPVRMLVSGVSGGVLGGADSAVRSDGDGTATRAGAAIGAGLGVAGPAVGKLVGAGVRAFTSRGRGNAAVNEALEGISDKDLASAQFLIEQAKSLPGGGVNLTLDEALNAVTGGQATRASQLARVVANSGGEGGRVMNEFYAGRPASIENVGGAGFEKIAPQNLDPTGLGFDVQAAAQAGVAQTPEGVALSQARSALGPRVSQDQAGQTIQKEMRGVADKLEAKRSEQANKDYAAARGAPENVGVERTVTVERPGEPIVTPQEYSRPQFRDGTPRPLDLPPTAEEAVGAGPISLARYIAQRGGIALDGDVLATDLHRFNIPGAGNVARTGGKSIDNHWREALIEAGYFRPDADGGAARDISSELLRKLQNEQRGVPSFPIGNERQAARPTAGRVADEYQAALSEAESRLNTDLRNHGVDPASVHPDVRDRVLGAMMRGEHPDPLDAFERVVGGMKENPQPLVKSTTVQEQIPDVRFGQFDPTPALDAVAAQGRTAKGDVRGVISATGRDLLENVKDPVTGKREPIMSVEEGLHARERLDQRIQAALKDGDATKVRDLTIPRKALDGSLKTVPEVATADANFAANSAKLEPFTGETPLGRIVRKDPQTERLLTPSETVPSYLQGASAAREFLANATPKARKAFEGRTATQIIEGATDKRGVIDPDKLHTAMREHADVLAQMPETYGRLEAVAIARDGLARVEASPLGRVATRDPDVKAAVNALFPTNPGAGTHQEIATAVSALAKSRPLIARQLVRYHLESVFNEATQDVKGIASQYGGAGFASAVRGNGQQRQNLEAAIRALPDGETILGGLDRMLTTLEATGYRPQKGSDTAFNTAIQTRLKEGAGPLGQAIAEVVSSASAGAGVGGVKGAAGGAVLGAKRAGQEALQLRRMKKDGEAIARILTDLKAIPMLRSLAKQPEGGRGAEMLTTKLLHLGYRGTASAVQGPSAAPR
ncbi:hypothetical protein [Methylobacterium brachythecii]|uniref:Uncharacterized protein n=1 Tax=Methylobacterium brachythecii TaxID=1176177 RepID=A0A7W6AQ05_9HYPH|nr:hypothetical protein [Methylobacterium brachythecii]MBB3905130.1 hypothetical protein [Methylobacterium brachythecii]GLS44362.1 hypothetical protein GCM10007884_23500 [Methylobacterium brachythecii]